MEHPPVTFLYGLSEWLAWTSSQYEWLLRASLLKKQTWRHDRSRSVTFPLYYGPRKSQKSSRFQMMAHKPALHRRSVMVPQNLGEIQIHVAIFWRYLLQSLLWAHNSLLLCIEIHIFSHNVPKIHPIVRMRSSFIFIPHKYWLFYSFSSSHFLLSS